MTKKERKNHRIGCGRKGRLNWFAGYAAAIDWVIQMTPKE